ncbi:hypothetical protein ACT3UJ_09620 [Halomonas sp. 86]|uniref:hypothetical protein n=1 Tax=unclassified Halomonas TaxID=2609666 RepID=UPI003F964524
MRYETNQQRGNAYPRAALRQQVKEKTTFTTLLALLYQSAKNSGTFYCKSASANLHEGAADLEAFRAGVRRVAPPVTPLAEHAFKHKEEHNR